MASQFLITLFGCFAIGLAFYSVQQCYQRERMLSSVLALMLLIEAVFGAVVGVIVVIVSVPVYLNVWNTMTPEIATLLRWAVFSITAGTALHLYCRLKRLA